jgi:hypothetical protein
VTSIATSAFSRIGKTTLEQSRITSVTISNSVTSIGISAFASNTDNSSLTIGSGLTTILNGAFNNNFALRTLVFPSNVITISGNAFQNIPLTSLTLNEGLTTIEANAFAGSKFKKLVIPNSVTTIGNAAFAINQIEELSIGTGVTALPTRVFDNSSKLQYLTIPSGITSLGENVFVGYSKSTYIHCGTSLSSAALSTAGLTSSTKVCPAVPGPPIIETATLASDTSATVTFTAPQHSGESVITSYTAVSSPDSIAASVNQSGSGSITVTGLRRGVSYTFSVYASNTGGAGASSDASPTVRTPDAPPTINSATISGSPIYGQTLTASAVGITGTSISTSYQWKRGGSNISGATNATYPLGGSDLSAQISVTITVTNASGSASATSDLTAGVAKATPTFSAWNNVSKYFGDSAFTVTAPTVTGSVPGSFSYSSATTSVISVSSSTLTVVGVGTSDITATFTPTDSTNYNSATTIMTVTVGTRSQSITRTSTSPSSPVKSGTYTPTATASSSLAVAISIASGSSSVCSISSGVVTFNTVGSCVIQYNESGNSNYSAATQVTETLTIGKATPTFSAWNNVSKNFGDSAFTVTAPTVTGSLAGSFTYTSETTSVISVSSSTLTVAGAGTSVITATFTPTDSTNYNSATTIMTVTVGKATPTFSAWNNVSKNFGDSAFTVTPPSVTGSVPGSFSYSSATTSVISVSGSTLTVAGAGTSDITATFTPNDLTNYNVATIDMTVTVGKALQSVVSLSSLSSTYNPSNKSISLTGSGGTGTGNYQYALNSSNSTPGCSVNGSTLTYTTAGTCVIAVTQTSDTNYLSRTDDVSFSISLASQTITFGSLSAKSYSSETFTVSATSSASLTVVFTSASQSVCTTSGVSGSTITLLSVGTCVINANQIGDSNIAAASQVSQNFAINPRPITVTADAKTKAYGAADPTLTYTMTTGSLVLGDAITGALTRAAGTDVGTYQIQQGALTTANNPKYAITFVAADLTITRATPALVLTYPNSNVAILRPGAVDTPTVTTSSSSGSLTFATAAASSICTVDATTGVISLFGAGSCPVAMSTALTTNYIAFTETTTVTVALLSTSLVGIDSSDLISMGQPFFSHASIDQSYSFSSGSNGASVAIPAGALDPSVPISIHFLADSTHQRTLIGGSGTSVLSVVVSWVASDGSVPSTNTGKAISVTLTNPAIKSGAKIYSIIGSQSTLLGTATTDGSITSLITEDPVLLVINPVVTTAAPSSSSGGSSGGGGYVMATVVDNSAAIEAANLKLAADKAAAELKAAQEKAKAAEVEAAAVKAAKDLTDAQAQAAAELKASQDKAAEELRIAEELRLAQLKAEADLKLAAEKKALADFATAARNSKSAVTLYSVSPSLKLNAYDSAYLAKYVKSLKNGAAVTCIGYTYGKSPASKASQNLAKRQASAVCAQMKKTNKTLKASVVIYPASKAPKAATGAKWVGVSYRIDGFKSN